MANRVTQAMAEVLFQNPAANTNARVTQVMVEVLQSIAPAKPSAGGSGKWFFRGIGIEGWDMDEELMIEQ
jgi:hypothetical protein